LDGANVTHLIYNYKPSFVQENNLLKTHINGTTKNCIPFVVSSEEYKDGGDNKNHHCYAPLGNAFVVFVFEME
jgi:hypothetical protein